MKLPIEWTFPCPTCHGTGWNGDVLCARCDAYGTVSELPLAPSSDDHELARFADEGNPHG
jgi:DnaJ-class molecular chaperone